MARILKHEIPAASEFTLPLYEGSKLLKLAVVNEKTYIWALEDESKPKRGVKFRMVMTGEEINLEPYMMYIGTFILFQRFVCRSSVYGHFCTDDDLYRTLK
ncbi:DUF7352 domain-containing protein [Phocaeicola plebeius]